MMLQTFSGFINKKFMARRASGDAPPETAAGITATELDGDGCEPTLKRDETEELPRERRGEFE